MKPFRVLFSLSLIFLTGCTGIPIRLKSAADQDMRFLLAEMATHEIYLEPVMVDQHQISDQKWCLTYEIGPDYYFSSSWERQAYDWTRSELLPYVENCDWAR